jgi:hypothetical protein
MMKRNILTIVSCAFLGGALGWWGENGYAQNLIIGENLGLYVGILIGGWISWSIIELQRGNDIRRLLPKIIIGHSIGVVGVALAISQGIPVGFFIGVLVGVLFIVLK